MIEQSLVEEKINILVNNAAYSRPVDFLAIDQKEYEMAMNVNVMAPFFLAQLVFPTMKEQGWGRVINVGSIGGQQGGQRQIHYAISKGALDTFTKSIARLGAQFGISSFNISPGALQMLEVIRIWTFAGVNSSC